jgi:hypothetical protein
MCHLPRPVIIQVGKGNLILCPHRVSNNDLADIIELVPVLVKIAKIPVERLKLRPTWYGNVKRLRGEEGLEVEQVVVVFVDDVGQHLVGQAVEVG